MKNVRKVMFTVMKRNSLMMIDLYMPVRVLYRSKTARRLRSFLRRMLPMEMMMDTRMERNVLRM